MLDELHVSNYALVRDAHLRFSPGCTVLSGETGAGKTALVGAIKMLIGERADVGSIRDGADELVVEGRIFEDSKEHVVTRRLSREGRSRCTLDEGMATVKVLGEQIGIYFDLHGQHEHQSLLTPAVQLKYLDRFAAHLGQEALERYQEDWDRYQEAKRALSELEEASASSEANLEHARFVVKEINALHPQEGEYEELEARLPILRGGEGLARASQSAYEALRDENGALERLSAAQHALARESGIDIRLDEMAERMESLVISADDLASTLREYRDCVEFDPQALEEALSRLGGLEGLRKRFGPRMQDVFSALRTATDQLEMTVNADEKMAQCVAQLAQREADLREAAIGLEAIRAQASRELADELNAAFADLAMGSASVQFLATELPFESWHRSASASYELLYRPGEGSVFRPLAKIASGGELSRVMLALKTLQNTPDLQVTLVFDEVDAGIGGATATAVARYIRRLANKQQVIVITHLAQIASVADLHYVVEKAVEEGVATTVIREVKGDDRVREIARMLSGSEDKVALEHAQQLLKGGEAQWL
jgi:DNA repair protein RecN (Recombination protein N)